MSRSSTPPPPPDHVADAVMTPTRIIGGVSFETPLVRGVSVTSTPAGGSGGTAVSSGSGLARMAVVKGEMKHGLGCFHKSDEGFGECINFKENEYISTSNLVTRNLVAIAHDAATESKDDIFALPNFLFRKLEKYLQPLLRINPEKAEAVVEIVRYHEAKVGSLSRVKAILERGDVSSESIDLNRVLFDRIFSESAEFLSEMHESLSGILAAMESEEKKIESKITSLEKDAAKRAAAEAAKSVAGAEGGDAGTAVEEIVGAVATASKIKKGKPSAQEIQRKREEAAKKREETGVVKVKVDPDELRKKLAECEKRRLEIFGSCEEEEIFDPPVAKDSAKKVDREEFLLYRIDATDANPKIAFTLENRSNRRPLVSRFRVEDGAYEKTATQGDHVTAYTLLLQLFISSIPAVGRYEDLHNRVVQMLELVFFGNEGNSFQQLVAPEFAEKVISDEERRSCRKRFKDIAGLSDEERSLLDNMVKIYQIECACNKVCKIANEYLKTVNAEHGASMHGGGGEGGGGVKIDRKEGQKIQILEEVSKYFAAENLTRLIDQDLRKLGPVSADQEKEYRRRTLEKLRREVIGSVSEESSARISSETLPKLCETIGKNLSGLIDLPNREKFAAVVGRDDLSEYKGSLKKLIARHFRIAGTMLASVINGLNHHEKPEGFDIADAIAHHFLEELKSKNPSFAGELTAIELDLVRGGDANSLAPITAAEESEPTTSFRKFLPEILKERAEKFRELYLVFGIGNAVDSPFKPVSNPHPSFRDDVVEPRVPAFPRLQNIDGESDIDLFLLIGRGAKKEFALLGITEPEVFFKKRSSGFFECKNRGDYEEAMRAIRTIIETSPKNNSHLILYGHGEGERIICLGKKIHPEDIFEELTRTKPMTISVVSCYSGDRSEEIKTKLGESQTVIIHAGKRSTISSADTARVLKIIDSPNLVPQLFSVKEDGSLELTPPETVKIITKDGVKKFSPFEAFKEDSLQEFAKSGKTLGVKEIFEEMVRQQIAMTRLLGLEEEVKRLEELNVDELLRNSEQEIKKYLRDLTFLVVATKGDEKIGYLAHLINLGVDPKEANDVRGEKLFLITEACAAGNIEMADFLIRRDREQLTKTTDSGLTPLMIACQKGQFRMVRNLLSLDERQISCQDRNGSNVLHHAAAGGNLELFEFLLQRLSEEEKAIFPAMQNRFGRTPTDEAIANNHLAVTAFAQQCGFSYDEDRLREKEDPGFMALLSRGIVPRGSERVAEGGVVESKSRD